MTFPAELERLLKEATEGPWIIDNNEGFSQWKIWGGMSPSGSGVVGPRIADVIGDSAEADANAELIALLRNHADAILELVQAADEIVRISDRKHDAWDAYKVARAKLNGEGK